MLNHNILSVFRGAMMMIVRCALHRLFPVIYRRTWANLKGNFRAHIFNQSSADVKRQKEEGVREKQNITKKNEIKAKIKWSNNKQQ